jgi:phospholipid/cholesterol/gamma-HCH transport system substrate-binding protein
MIQHATGAGAAPRNRLSQEELRAMAPMRTPRREVHVGIFVIVGVLAVLTALFVLTDPGTFRGRYHVTTVVQDAGGIRKGDPVRLKGVNVGRIRDFQIEEEGVRMFLELQRQYPIPADSRISVVSGGLLQSMVAEVIPGQSDQPLRDGAELVSVDTETMTATAERLGGSADTLLMRANLLLSQQTIGAVGASAQQMQELLTQLTAFTAEQRVQMAALTTSLRRSAVGLEASATRPELARAIARTDSMTLRLDAASGSLQQASASLAALTARVEGGEGTLGRLTTDDELYRNLNAAVTSLNELTADIKANPRRYINVSVF